MVSPRVLRLLSAIVLSAVGAELLAAYGDSTGDPGLIAFSVLFFGALYGAPALVAREMSRRAGWGWPSMLLIFASLGVAQACLIDQSMFNDSYQGYQGWEESWQATLIPGLGINAYNAVNFVPGHVVFSFGAPIALAEAWHPAHARTAWLGPVGIAFAAVAYAGAVALVAADPESQSASTTQFVVSSALVGGLLALAWLAGRRATREIETGTSAPSLTVTFVVAMALAVVSGSAPETWLGFGMSVTALGAAGVLMTIASRRTGWAVRHTATVALAYLLSRGMLAFLYFPLLGEVSAAAKYAHNVTMLAVVLVAGWFALRPTNWDGSNISPHRRPGPRRSR